MRSASVMFLAIAGCSTAPSPSTLPPARAPAAGSITGATVAGLVPAGATAIMKADAASFPLLGSLHHLFSASTPPCWGALEARMVAGYQIEVRSEHTSVFVFEGDLPRDEVEACAKLVVATAPVPFTVRREGEFTVIDGGSLGAAHVASRGRFLVAGRRELVREALAGSPGNTWAARLAALPPAPLAGSSSDALFANLLRIPTAGWDIVFDEFGKQGGQPAIRGHVLVHASTAADAALAARRIADGDLWFPVAVPPPLLAALRRLRTSVHDRDLQLDFDLAMFDGVDFAAISELGDRLRAVQPAP